MIIKARKLHPYARLPTKNLAEDACWDLYVAEPATVLPGGVAMLDTKIALELPRGFFAQILGRSGLAAKGIDVLGGVVDSNFRGAVKVIVANVGDAGHAFAVGDRAGQFAIHAVPLISIAEADELSPSERNEAGFGSSGR